MKISLAMLLLSLFCASASANPGGADMEDSHVLLEDILTITSSKGIGRLRISSEEMSWGKLKYIRFQYRGGQGYTRLEGLSFKTDRLLAQGQAPSAEGLEVTTLSGDKKDLKIPLFGREEGLVAEIPPEFLKEAEFLELHWVDFYR